MKSLTLESSQCDETHGFSLLNRISSWFFAVTKVIPLFSRSLSPLFHDIQMQQSPRPSSTGRKPYRQKRSHYLPIWAAQKSPLSCKCSRKENYWCFMAHFGMVSLLLKYLHANAVHWIMCRSECHNIYWSRACTSSEPAAEFIKLFVICQWEPNELESKWELIDALSWFRIESSGRENEMWNCFVRRWDN